jgi:hypothetical protein
MDSFVIFEWEEVSPVSGDERLALPEIAQARMWLSARLSSMTLGTFFGVYGVVVETEPLADFHRGALMVDSASR